MHVGFLSCRIYHLDFQAHPSLSSANNICGVMLNISAYFLLFNPHDNPYGSEEPEVQRNCYSSKIT